jgi:hypothetical protein
MQKKTPKPLTLNRETLRDITAGAGSDPGTAACPDQTGTGTGNCATCWTECYC